MDFLCFLSRQKRNSYRIGYFYKCLCNSSCLFNSNQHKIVGCLPIYFIKVTGGSKLIRYFEFPQILEMRWHKGSSYSKSNLFFFACIINQSNVTLYCVNLATKALLSVNIHVNLPTNFYRTLTVRIRVALAWQLWVPYHKTIKRSIVRTLFVNTLKYQMSKNQEVLICVQNCRLLIRIVLCKTYTQSIHRKNNH